MKKIYITDPEIWDHIAEDVKIWWLIEKHKFDPMRCDDCAKYACICEGENSV